jgi:hypothetical protein
MINDGGPAFPCETIHPCGSHEQVDGLTIRDYFAAQAMQAMLANPHCDLNPLREVIPAAYELADAMLKEREK